MNNFRLSLNFGATAITKILETHIAENRETIIPIQSITQNPLIRFIQNMKRITAETNEVTCESQIADHDFSNQIFMDFITSVFALNSSLDLSKINILASIARPMESINHAIEDRVSTIQLNLTIVRTSIRYPKSAIHARRPDTL
jgi:hypothetical protein